MNKDWKKANPEKWKAIKDKYKHSEKGKATRKRRRERRREKEKKELEEFYRNESAEGKRIREIFGRKR